jgi:hypothetical protein
MMRQLKIARDTAVKARTSAIMSLKQIIVNAPAELRESLAGLADKALIDRCAGFRPGSLDSTTASAKHTLRALARRWLFLNDEIHDHDRHLDQLTAEQSPTLRDGFGVGADTAAEMLIIFGDDPERIRSEAAFAKLCGACPIPASSGMTTGTAPPLQGRAPPSERRALPLHDRAHALPPADHRLRHPTHRRGHAEARVGSIRNSAFSRSNWRSLARSSTFRPSFSPRSTRSRSTQLPNVPELTPRSLPPGRSTCRSHARSVPRPHELGVVLPTCLWHRSSS